jgi:hypothetical protein
MHSLSSQGFQKRKYRKLPWLEKLFRMETKCEVEVFPLYCYRSDNNSRKSAKLKSSLVLTSLKKKTGLSHMQALKAA